MRLFRHAITAMSLVACNESTPPIPSACASAIASEATPFAVTPQSIVIGPTMSVQLSVTGPTSCAPTRYFVVASDTATLTVTAGGFVQAKKVGEAYVHVLAADNTIRDSSRVRVAVIQAFD